jgi:flagellar basal-body rod modification protein FlgD
MQNQDPLNPMDNAQVTSQMAQINTVSASKGQRDGPGLNGQLVQLQALQSARTGRQGTCCCPATDLSVART